LVQCIFIYTANEKDKVKRMKIARQSKALHVRGRQIILWARHLAKVRF
jgi:hypothetical protein